jgi:hypothetical protein
MNKKDRNVLRRLAARVREIAELPIMAERQRQWCALNDLNSEKAMVLVSPEGAWREIDTLLTLECENGIARGFERNLRRKIYQHEHICDDWVVDADFDIPLQLSDSGYGVERKREVPNAENGAFKHIPPIKDIDRDLGKLRFRKITVHQESSDARFELAQEAFGDLLNLSHNGAGYFWTTGLTGTGISLIGLEELMLYMFDNPDGLKRFMQFMSDEMANYMDQLERLGVLGYNNGNHLVGSGNWGLTSDLPSKRNPVDGPIDFSHRWGFCESQETVGISPDMFGEFIFPYQKPLIDRFGLSYYGCCEPVEDRFDYIKQCRNLRCVSVSPWSNVEKCAEVYGRNYVLCHKPNPSLICVEFIEDACRREIRDVLDKAAGLNLMFILKDTHTISNQPERFKRWVEIVREEIAR